MSPLKNLRDDPRLSIRAIRGGHVRLGAFADGRPQESPTFVFTSTDEHRLTPLARDFGGDVHRYTPQGGGEEPWRLLSTVDAFTALFPFTTAEENVSQDYVLWKRMGLARRCDGETATEYVGDGPDRSELERPCVCAELGEKECVAETRIRLFLPQTGFVVWELVTHSIIGASELWTQAQAIERIAEQAGGTMNHVPIRVVWSPRRIAYFDRSAGKRRTTTKRVVSLMPAGDAVNALAAMGLPPSQALLAAVRSVMGKDAMPSGERPALGTGSGGDGMDGEAPAVAADPREERIARPSPRDCEHPSWTDAPTPGMQMCETCGVARRKQA